MRRFASAVTVLSVLRLTCIDAYGSSSAPTSYGAALPGVYGSPSEGLYGAYADSSYGTYAAADSDRLVRGITIVSCDTDGLRLEVSDPDISLPIPGDVIWNVAASKDPAQACATCAQWGAVITAVGEPEECLLGGDSCVAVQVTSRDATLLEFVDDSILEQLNFTSIAANTTFKDVLGCDAGGTSGSGRRLTGTTSASNGRTLLQAFAPPETCAGWKAVGADGRCVYSNCFVGGDSTPINPNCFGCDQNECNNGCGAQGGLDFAESREGVDRTIFDFTEGCCKHDHCWSSTAFSREECDQFFYADNLLNCEALHGTAEDVIVSPARQRIIARRGPQTPADRAFAYRRQCLSQAFIYYSAVSSFFATGAYDDANAMVTDWERSNNCVAQCPSTQESGGQGTTRLRIDMKQTSGTFPLAYEMFTIPDELKIDQFVISDAPLLEGQEIRSQIFSTGGLVSGGFSGTATFDGSSTIVEVTIRAPNEGTLWNVFIGCPE